MIQKDENEQIKTDKGESIRVFLVTFKLRPKGKGIEQSKEPLLN